MSVLVHPSRIGAAREVTTDTGTSDDNQLITSTLEHGALSQPTFGSVTLNLYPSVRIWQVEIGNVNGIWC